MNSTTSCLIRQASAIMTGLRGADARQAAHSAGSKHGASTNQRSITNRRDDGFDAAERIGRVHGDLENLEASANEDPGDLRRSGGFKSPQDSKQWQPIGKFMCFHRAFLHPSLLLELTCQNAIVYLSYKCNTTRKECLGGN